MSSQPVAPVYESGLIVRELEPVNQESPFDLLSDGPGARGRLTPNHLFYIRSHFKAPHLDAATHALSIEGGMQSPFALSVGELKKLAAVTRVATLECAGNGRVFLTPAEQGAQWQLGAVATAEWTGVPLGMLLDRAGLRPEAVEIVFEGAELGKPKEKPVPPGEIKYARSLPVAKAREVLIAYAMNGEEIPVDHGYPIRAIVPGYYGMASVKWLTRIYAATEPFRGYWQTSDYAYWGEEGGLPVRLALGEVQIKSSIARPRVREVIAAGKPYTVFGAAWTGGPEIAAVEVSTDGGETWSAAELIDAHEFGVWRRWRFVWQARAEPREYVLKSRARDVAGGVQADEHDKRYGSYVINHTVAIGVTVG